MKFVCCWLFVSLSSALWVEAATLRSAPMVGVWAATGTPLRATVELQDAQDRVQPIKSHGGRVQAVRGVLLTIHQADRPSSASLIAPQQWFSVVDVGLDACEITYYQAVARSASGTQLRLMLADRRSVVRLDCLTNITKGRPPWSVTIYEVDESRLPYKIYPCTRPLPTWMVRPTAMMIWQRGVTSGSVTPGWASSASGAIL